MTEILIKYYNLAAVFMEKKIENRDLLSDTTCLDLMIILANENERFGNFAFDVDGIISNRIRIFRNGKISIDLNEILKESDEISIFSAISGG